jgi:hypothetical protein
LRSTLEAPNGSVLAEGRAGAVVVLIAA